MPGVDLRIQGRVRSLHQHEGSRTDFEIREFSVVWRASETTVTLGAQQLNWGRMDILRITDAVNAVDQQDLFYEELSEAKLASWMANMEWQSGSQTIQVIAAPRVPMDRLPARLQGVPIVLSRPNASLANTTFAARYGLEWQGWNADLIAIRGWQSAPELRPLVGGSGLILYGAMSRQDSLGFSADKPFGATVVRLEAAYARLTPVEQLVETGVDARRQATFGVGLDLRVGNWFIAGQVAAQNDLQRERDTRGTAFVSAIVQRKWLQDRLSARALHIRETRTGSSWSSLQASLEISPNHLLQLQGDLFSGPEISSFGAFKARSRVAASTRLQF